MQQFCWKSVHKKKEREREKKIKLKIQDKCKNCLLSGSFLTYNYDIVSKYTKLQSTTHRATDLDAKRNLFSVRFELAFGRTHGLVLLHIQVMTDLCAPNAPRHLVRSIPLRTDQR